MFGRTFVNKFPWLVVFSVVGILEFQILRISDNRTDLRREEDAQSVHNKSPSNIRRTEASEEEEEEDGERTVTQIKEVSFDDQSIYDDTIILYNRVPKTASTSFMGVVYDLCEINNFHTLHLNITRNMHIMSIADQLRFANNITRWRDRIPALYHGHVEFINFRKLGISRRILYINIIRKPLDRLVSYYYFLRFGDTFRPYKRRSRQGDKETFDECVARGHKDCKPEKLWVQIPFFCGHAPQCLSPGSKWALEQAKRHLVEHYLLVGLTEQLDDFIAVLETALPRFFKGATKLFRDGSKAHLRKTTSKKPLEQITIEHFRQSKIWKMENEFYEFAKKVFNTAKKRSRIVDDADGISSPVQFFYEKIRPK